MNFSVGDRVVVNAIRGQRALVLEITARPLSYRPFPPHTYEEVKVRFDDGLEFSVMYLCDEDIRKLSLLELLAEAAA